MNEAKAMIESQEGSLKGVALAGINLREEEFALLQQLVTGPAYPLLQKLLIMVGAQTMTYLELQDEPREIYRVQGQIKAFRWLQNFPGLMVREEQKKRENKEKVRLSKNQPRPASP